MQDEEQSQNNMVISTFHSIPYIPHSNKIEIGNAPVVRIEYTLQRTYSKKTHCINLTSFWPPTPSASKSPAHLLLLVHRRRVLRLSHVIEFAALPGRIRREGLVEREGRARRSVDVTSVAPSRVGKVMGSYASWSSLKSLGRASRVCRRMC